MKTTRVLDQPQPKVAADPCKTQQSGASQEDAVAAPTIGRQTYGQILKSSALIGGSTVLNIGIGIIRTKAMAVMLGPAGFGLMSLYGSILDLALVIAGMGINSSGVRQIAEAANSGDQDRIARTAIVLRRTAIILGLLGAISMAALSRQISIVTFGTDQQAGAVALLSVAVFFGLVASGRGALIQGMRRIVDLARMGVLGALFGAVVSVALVYVFGEGGIAPAMACGAAIGLLIAVWFSRKVRVSQAEITRAQLRQEAGALLKLGFAFMASGFLMMGAAYVVRMIVVRDVGLEAAGLYQSAWTLGGLYVGIILQSMGADFYPRLVGVANDNAECNRVVNEQTHVSLLLAGPGVVATLTFAPVVIYLFYTPKFAEAVDVLRWICLGIAMRVITWPLGYIIVAKNRRALFLGVDLAWTLVNVGLTWICVAAFGLDGAGIAFFGSYVFHALVVYPIVRVLSGFRWSGENLTTGLLFIFSIAIVFVVIRVLPSLTGAVFGVVMTVAASLYSLWVLLNLFTLDRLPRPIQQLVAWLRAARAATR